MKGYVKLDYKQFIWEASPESAHSSVKQQVWEMKMFGRLTTQFHQESPRGNVGLSHQQVMNLAWQPPNLIHPWQRALPTDPQFLKVPVCPKPKLTILLWPEKALQPGAAGVAEGSCSMC